MSKERFKLRWCLVFLLLFLVATRIVYQGYIMRDDLGIYFSLSIIVKKIKKHSKFD